MVDKPAEIEPFDPNDAGDPRLPSAKSTIGVPVTMEQYVDTLARHDHREPSALDKCLEAFQKALAIPPKVLTFVRLSFMPDPQNEGVLSWPGIPPEALRHIVSENVAPQLIIGMRCDDVLRYATHSNHPWKPGWKIELRQGKKHPDEGEERRMREAEEFLSNCNAETGVKDARDRDAAGLTDFSRFLTKLVRDTLTYDGIAIWTDMDNGGKVKSFSLLPAGHIRLVDPSIGYRGDKNIYAVAVDEGNSVVHTFRRDQLVWYVRNARVDPEIAGYGYPEPEMAMKFIQGFQNALDLNLGTFNQSAIPNGMLVLTGGGYNQKQLDTLTRVWNNLKRGITKTWSLPVIATPKDGKVELVNLQDLKGDDARYQDFMNMVAGGFCTIYRFPPRRLGYRISGKGPDAKPLPDQTTELVDDDDPGLAPLLGHIENVINEYLLWTRWPDLRFCFTGKNPKEDAREYEAKKNAQTWKEARAQADLTPLTEEIEGGDEEMKAIGKLMEMAPVDPNLGGVFQSVAAAFLKAKFAPQQGEGKDPETPGNRMTSNRDPAKSEAHGATSGVRRNSRAEGGK